MSLERRARDVEIDGGVKTEELLARIVFYVTGFQVSISTAFSVTKSKR